MLDGWSEGGDPTVNDSRHMVGSWAAKAASLFFVFEWAVHYDWTGAQPYNYGTNVVSDLGATGCAVASASNCTHSFVAMDLAFVSIGIGLFATSCLITSPVLWVGGHSGDLRNEYEKWRNPDPHAVLRGSAGPTGFVRTMTALCRWLLALTGVSLTIIGLVPENVIRQVHDSSVVALGIGMCLWLISMSVLWFKRTYWVFAFILLAIIAGFGGWVLWHGTNAPGMYERFMIYPFIVGMAIMGIMITVGASRERRGMVEPRHRRPWQSGLPVPRIPRLKPRHS
ncbi:DUF998 domain-containing protein [Arthrobacter sp. GN70]|uniref:DUF998 domain-containing protein n=1 Tax=Arthrobacter sp. GN70 TaxID=2838876 RepID=UPI001BFCE30B|nr:DUF998 domain-containing protein [Arthrobacter sp. GN70]